MAELTPAEKWAKLTNQDVNVINRKPTVPLPGQHIPGAVAPKPVDKPPPKLPGYDYFFNILFDAFLEGADKNTDPEIVAAVARAISKAVDNILSDVPKWRKFYGLTT